MAYKIIVSPSAQINIDKAIEYYIENASFLVASEFFDELQNCYRHLELNPFNQIRIKSYRASPLDRFPYLVFYELDEEQPYVRILAVFNTNQDPGKWP